MDKYVKYKILKNNIVNLIFGNIVIFFTIINFVKIFLPNLLHLFGFYYNYLYKFTRYLTFYE